MAALPALRKMAVEAIGAALTEQDIQDLWMQATGEDVFNTIGTPSDPRAILISKALAQLETTGTERWLLTLILIAIAEDKLRMLIVKTWPTTLIRLPQAESQVAKALQYLGLVLHTPLSSDLKHELKPKHDSLDEIRRRIALLYAYKSLHEYLHVLHLKIVVSGLAQGVAPEGPDFKGILDRCDEIADQAPALLALLISKDVETNWIARLATLATALKAAVAASDLANGLAVRDSILALVRIHLSRLNMQVFRAAKELSFEALIKDYPLDIETTDAFIVLVQAIRELKPTVIARALKQSMWQEVENEISLIANLFSAAGTEFSEFSEHWFALKSRVLWLATLDPDDPWVQQAQQCSDGISDALVRERLDDDIKHRFDDFQNILRFRFLAIDNALKQDCSSLRKIDPPLTELLGELTS